MDLKIRGCLPVDCLEMPLIELLQRRQRKDEERGHHSNARRCQTVTWLGNFMGFNNSTLQAALGVASMGG
jgi:hypothetical protein